MSRNGPSNTSADDSLRHNRRDSQAGRSRTALVTGAGRGIGRAIAIAFAHAGYNVACVSRTRSEVENVAAVINLTTPYEAGAFVCDCSDANALHTLVRDVRRWNDRPVHVLVNNAGCARVEAVEHQSSMTPWQRIMDTNLNGPVALIYQLLPDMLARESGVLISIGSRNAIYTVPYMSAYSVSKTGLFRFHQNLQREIGDRGVANFFVVPGLVASSILEPEDAIDRASVDAIPGVRRTVEYLTGAKMGSAEPVANLCVRLALDDSLRLLSGRFVDTEDNLETILEDLRQGEQSRCVTENLYMMRVDKL
ncbi:hypothetical protein LMH87_010732 [Akanthomyces muscarius]|uniref:Uncharacterized protein n=1 Tax=Akanthomyces muscarius TaxID=2231603 RepID=A0A9W8UKE9_AKAMU|nr:hypothetical protein LMH87_010732 [Akanthomyces muscarius]KAJ4149960.1 hypothetical protein LMH87_010732 [Akanthomyces muscarius]